MSKNRKTSNSVASTAAKLLSNDKSSKAVKKVAGSALSQAAPKSKKQK